MLLRVAWSGKRRRPARPTGFLNVFSYLQDTHTCSVSLEQQLLCCAFSQLFFTCSPHSDSCRASWVGRRNPHIFHPFRTRVECASGSPPLRRSAAPAAASTKAIRTRAATGYDKRSPRIIGLRREKRALDESTLPSEAAVFRDPPDTFTAHTSVSAFPWTISFFLLNVGITACDCAFSKCSFNVKLYGCQLVF